MRITILFGGTNKERLVSVASAQALHRTLPDADLWFWDVADTVHQVTSGKLLATFASVRGPVRAGWSRHSPRASARSGQGRGPPAGARAAWRPGGEWRVAGDVRGAWRSVHRFRFGVIASGFRQGGGQAFCGARRGDGAGRRGARRCRCGARSIRQADRQAGAGWFELRADLCQRDAGSRRRPECGKDRGLSDRTVRRGSGNDLRRARTTGRFHHCAAAGRDRRRRTAISTIPRNIWRRPRRKFVQRVLLRKSTR